jgi:hypothetical protein
MENRIKLDIEEIHVFGQLESLNDVAIEITVRKSGLTQLELLA